MYPGLPSPSGSRSVSLRACWACPFVACPGPRGENEVGVSVADREEGEFGPRGPRGSYSWYAGVLGVGGSAIVDADNGKGVETGDITGVVKAEPAPGDFTLEGAGGPEGCALPDTFVNIAAADSGFGRGPKFV